LISITLRQQRFLEGVDYFVGSGRQEQNPDRGIVRSGFLDFPKFPDRLRRRFLLKQAVNGDLRKIQTKYTVKFPINSLTPEFIARLLEVVE